MGAGASGQVKNAVKRISTQDGIIGNINNILFRHENKISEKQRETFFYVLKIIMFDLIKRKVAFSDDLLNLLWKLGDEKEKVNLWDTIKKQCEKILCHSDDKDWYWLQNYMLKSSIWNRRIDDTGLKAFEKKKNNKKGLGMLASILGKSKEKGQQGTDQKEPGKAQPKTEKGPQLNNSDTTVVKDQGPQVSDDMKTNEEAERIRAEAEAKEQERREQEEEEKKAELEQKEQQYDVKEILFYDLNELCSAAITKTTTEKNKDANNNKNKSFAKFFEDVNNKLQVLRTMTAEMRSEKLRQDDTRYAGLQPKYTHSDLTTQVHPTVDFSAHLHYDINEYLSALVLAAHNVNHKFQHEMKDKFLINVLTFRNEDEGIRFTEGPVKKLHRCQAKAETKYLGAKYPTSARLIDIVRCSLIFDTIDDLIAGIGKFSKTVAASQIIKEIVRIKNMFSKYNPDNPQYADIKMNVLIKGKPNVIGEVQFLLKRMADFKKVSHKIYDITRQKELYNNIYNVLSTHKSIKTSLEIAAELGSSSRLCDLMVTVGITEENWLERDEHNDNILYNMCKLNRSKAFRMLLNITTNKVTFVDNILINKTTGRQQNAMFWIITRDCIEIWNMLWELPEFSKRILSNEENAILTISGQNRNKSQKQVTELTKVAIQIFLDGDDRWIDLIRTKLIEKVSPDEWIKFIQKGPGEEGKTWLMYAAEKGKTKMANEILKSFGIEEKYDENNEAAKKEKEKQKKEYLQKKYTKVDKEKGVKYPSRQAIEMCIDAPNGTGADVLKLLIDTYDDLGIPGSSKMISKVVSRFNKRYSEVVIWS